MMRKILFGVLVAVLLASSAWAVENSVTFMPLVSSARFLDRVSFNIDQEAPVVLAEAGATGGSVNCHQLRAALAVKVAQNPQGYSNVFAVMLAGHINVTSAGALTGAGATLDTPATDAALFSAVAALWSNIAGCITNP